MRDKISATLMLFTSEKKSGKLIILNDYRLTNKQRKPPGVFIVFQWRRMSGAWDVYACGTSPGFVLLKLLNNLIIYNIFTVWILVADLPQVDHLYRVIHWLRFYRGAPFVWLASGGSFTSGWFWKSNKQKQDVMNPLTQQTIGSSTLYCLNFH